MPLVPATAAPAAPYTPDADVLIDSAAARALAGGISDMTLRRWIARGILPKPRHIERRRFWKRGEVLAALAAHSEPPPASPAPAGPKALAAARAADAPPQDAAPRRKARTRTQATRTGA